MFSDPFTKAIIAFFHLGHVVFSVIDLKSCLFSVYSMVKASLCSMILPPNPCYQFRIHYHSLIEAYRGCVPSVTFLRVGFSFQCVMERRDLDACNRAQTSRTATIRAAMAVKCTSRAATPTHTTIDRVLQADTGIRLPGVLRSRLRASRVIKW